MSDLPLTTDRRTAVVEAIIHHIGELYVFPERASIIAGAIRKHLDAGSYAQVATERALCDLLTAHIQAVRADPHLAVLYSPEPLLTVEAQPSQAEIRAVRHAYAVAFNGGCHKVERLPGNIGLIELRAFEEPEFAMPVLAAAMQLITNTAALLIDLRRCTGGHPGTVTLLCSYFFASRVHLNSFYWRSLGDSEEFWTLEKVAGPRYLHKPLYLLTSRETFSAAEEFAYNLQSQQRATVIGEPTRGGAHVVNELLISPHIVAVIPVGQAMNPVTKTNWAGNGVLPNMRVAQEDALATAHRFALQSTLAKDELHPRVARELRQEREIALQKGDRDKLSTGSS